MFDPSERIAQGNGDVLSAQVQLLPRDWLLLWKLLHEVQRNDPQRVLQRAQGLVQSYLAIAGRGPSSSLSRYPGAHCDLSPFAA